MGRKAAFATALVSAVWAAGVLGIGIGSPGALAAQNLSSPTGADVRQRVEAFAHKRYTHGVPYLEARALGTEALPILKAMLADVREEEYWPTIVTIMGFIGDPGSTDDLVGFLENRFAGEVTLNQFRALLLVNGALGHIAGNGGVRALEYLAQGARASTWLAKDLKWSYRHHAGEDLAVLLAKIAVNGLSFSGTERAREILSELQRNPESARTGLALKSNIEEGLPRIERLQREGAARVFGGP
jgi:hypothetical protein